MEDEVFWIYIVAGFLVMLGASILLSRLFKMYRVFWTFVLFCVIYISSAIILPSLAGQVSDWFMNIPGYFLMATFWMFPVPFFVTLLSPFMYLVYWRKRRALRESLKEDAQEADAEVEQS